MESEYKAIAVDPQAYFFFPNDKEQKTSFDKNGVRFFFYGQIEHDEYEKKKLAEFDEFLKKNSYELNPELWKSQRILLFLAGNGYKNQETYDAIKSHETFRTDYLGPNNEKVKFDAVAYLINAGFFYPCGRDKQFRPILVFNCKKIDLKDFENSFKASVFVHEQIMQHMFIPGQVESWNIIYDLGGMGVTEIPSGVLKSMMQKMSSNYGGKLHRLWVVNAPLTISISWKVISAFLQQTTVDKIKISKSSGDKDMWNNCDKSQIEVKYGGTQPNRKTYWYIEKEERPFEIPEGVFDKTRLISEDEYKKRLDSGLLKHNKIHPKFK